MNALEVLNSEPQKLEEFKDNQNNNQDNTTIMNQSNIPSSIVEIKRTPKSQSRVSNSQGSATTRPLDNHDITELNDNSAITEPLKDSIEDRTDESKKINDNDDNDFAKTIKSSNSQQEIVRRSQSIPNMRRENALTMTGTAAKSLNKSKSAQVSYKQSNILGSFVEVLHNNTYENNLESIKNNTPDHSKNNNNSSIINDTNESKNDDEANNVEIDDKTKRKTVSRRSNSTLDNPKRILGSLDTNLVDNSYQYKNTSGSRKSSRNHSQRSSRKNSRRNSETGSSKRISSRGSTNSIHKREKDNLLRTQSSLLNVAKNERNYKEKIILYNTNKNKVAYMVTNEENKEENRPVIIQSSNIFDVDIDNKSDIHEVIVKIEQNQDTKDFIKSLDDHINKNLCYTDYFDINRGNQYGSCSVQIREATYLSVPCYYIAKKVLVKNKTNDEVINHLEFVSYVTPKLVTLHQNLLQQKNGGPSYNQHVDYNKKNKLIAIEQYHYKSDSTIKQIFDCDQYLSEGAIEIMNRILIENEVKPHTYNFLTFVRGIMYQINTTTYPGIENAYFQGKRLPYSVIKIENEILPRSDHVNIYEEVDAIRIFSDYQELAKANDKVNEISNSFSNDKEEELSNSSIINRLNNQNSQKTIESKVDKEKNLIKNNSYDDKEKSTHAPTTDDLHKNDANEFEENNDGVMLSDLNVPNFTISNSQNNLTFEQLIKNNAGGSDKLYNSNFDVNSSLGSCNLVEIAKNVSGSGNMITVDEINMKKGIIPSRKLKNENKKDDDVTTRYNNIETKICCPKRGCLIFEDELNQLHCENKIKYNDTIEIKSFLDEQENLSIYHEYKNTYTKKYLRYIKYNESLKFMLQDFVQSIFFHKPKDVYQFTKNYFSNE
ncbi:hypothetical protein H8356DRAFT_1652641 [Neocallimastix lanati (nom. inval.)]|nr:hypothetical protein H8356DRAFT_1652641 [Neocallimastix sp. JGI-2020a]